jgi:N-acetyl-anhydromuramyl-L-alanine amidase AmpD
VNSARPSGLCSWNGRTNLDNIAIGIEIVNSGDEPFPNKQIIAVATLSKQIIKRYEIAPNNIVAHGDIAPTRREDVSGYFDWNLFYSQLQLFPRLFETNLTKEEQHMIIFSANSTQYEPRIETLQKNLKRYSMF